MAAVKRVRRRLRGWLLPALARGLAAVFGRLAFPAAQRARRRDRATRLDPRPPRPAPRPRPPRHRLPRRPRSRTAGPRPRLVSPPRDHPGRVPAPVPRRLPAGGGLRPGRGLGGGRSLPRRRPADPDRHRPLRQLGAAGGADQLPRPGPGGGRPRPRRERAQRAAPRLPPPLRHRDPGTRRPGGGAAAAPGAARRRRARHAHRPGHPGRGGVGPLLRPPGLHPGRGGQDRPPPGRGGGAGVHRTPRRRHPPRPLPPPPRPPRRRGRSHRPDDPSRSRRRSAASPSSGCGCTAGGGASRWSEPRPSSFPTALRSAPWCRRRR